MTESTKLSTKIIKTLPAVAGVVAGAAAIPALGPDAIAPAAFFGAMTQTSLAALYESYIGDLFGKAKDWIGDPKRDTKTFLQNEHLRKLVVLSIEQTIRSLVDDSKMPNAAKDKLPLVADNVQPTWEALSDDLAAHLVQVDLIDNDIQRGFVEARDNPNPKTLTVEHWDEFLSEIESRFPESYMTPDGKTYIAKRLHHDLLTNVRTLATKDTETGGAAFAALQLRILADIYGAVKDTQKQVKGSKGKTKKADKKVLKKQKKLMRQLRLVGGTLTKRHDRIIGHFQALGDKIDDLPNQDQFNAAISELKQNHSNWSNALTEINNKLDQIGDGVDSANDKLDEVLDILLPDDPNIAADAPDQQISNVRKQINVQRRFIARKQLMDNLIAKLNTSNRTAITQTAAIHGLGGVGKTQLALEYVLRHENQYKIVWWIKAETEQGILTDLAGLGEELGLPVGKELEANVNRLLKHLATISDWLLVYDNIPEVDDVRKWLPGSENGQILITSRSTKWGGVANPLTVKVMEPAEAIELLLTRSGDDNKAAAIEIAQRVGHLPLALEVAAAFCESTETSLAEYNQLLANRGLELLDIQQAANYPDVISATWQQSFDKAKDDCKQVVDILNTLAFVDADDFPLSVLETKLGDTLLLKKALKELLKYSLVQINKDEQSVSIHRLVQEVYRDHLSDGDNDVSIINTLALLAGVIETNTTDRHESSTWFEYLFPHCQAFCSYAATFINKQLEQNVDSQPNPNRKAIANLARVYNEMANYLVAIARYSDAESLLLRALNFAEESFGPNALPVSYLLNNFSLLLKATSRSDEAVPIMHRVLEINETLLGSHHQTVATMLNNLAEVLQDLGRLNEAEPLLRRALAINEKLLDESHPHVATVLSNLAWLLNITNRWGEAEPMMRRALRIHEQSYGPDHTSVATDLNNLAHLLQTTGKIAEAEPLIRRALEIDKTSYGPNHPRVAVRLSNLAKLFHASNRTSEAEPLMRRALEIDENSLGPEHPNVAIRLNNLAQLMKATNRLEDAEPLMRRALEIVENSFGAEHPKVAIGLNNLASLLQDTHRLEEAEPLMRRALKINENTFGPDHPNVAVQLNNLASLLTDTGRLKEAEPLFVRAIKVHVKSKAANGFEHPHMKPIINNFKGLLQRMGLSEKEIEQRIQSILNADNE